MKIRDIKFDVTTSAGGAFDETSGETVVGRLVAVEVVDTDLDATADITIKVTASPSGVDRNVFVLTDFTASVFRDVGGLRYDIAGASTSDFVHPLVIGKIQCVVAQGGNVKTGVVHCYVEE